MFNEDKYILALKKGSYKDFSLLYDYYAPILYDFSYKLLKSREEAKDIVQETFLKIWQKKEELDINQSFKAFLFTIARNRIYNEFRQRVNSPLMEDYIDYINEKSLTTNSIEEDLDFEEFNKALTTAKEKLTPRQKEIFEKCKEQGISVSEISQELDITEQSVRNQLSKAVITLKEELKNFLPLFNIFF